MRSRIGKCLEWKNDSVLEDWDERRRKENNDFSLICRGLISETSGYRWRGGSPGYLGHSWTGSRFLCMLRWSKSASCDIHWYVPLVYILIVMLLQLGTILLRCVQVEFTAMREQYMRCGEGFMICYSVTDRHSFQETMEYRKLISRVRANEDIPLVLVGNKCDLQQQRKVYWIISRVDITKYT